MSKRTLIAIALVVMTVSVVGAASYTSATVDRQASIGVEADSTAIIGLAPGGVPGITENTAGQLEIDLVEGAGLNTEAEFAYGDTGFSTSTDAHAFTIENNAASTTYDYTLSYGSIVNDEADSTDNVQFYVYDDTGTVQGSGPVTESASQTITVTPTDTYYVVIVVDTTGQTSTADLSGTLTISAAP